jgi:hypothetical protein
MNMQDEKNTNMESSGRDHQPYWSIAPADTPPLKQYTSAKDRTEASS